MELFKILLRHLKSGAWYVLTKGYEIVGFVVKILKIIIFETLRIPFLLVNKLVLLFWKIVRFPFLVTIKILGYVIFMFSVFFGPSHKSSKIGARFLAIICLALIGFGSWAGMSEFDKVITAQAKVISSENLQTIQHFEGGIIKKIHVKSGQTVVIGEPLISLEPLEQEASYEAKKSEFLQALIKVRRLDSEYRGEAPKYSSELKEIAESQISNELLLLKARRARLKSTLDSFNSQIKQKESELEGAEKTLTLVEKEKEVILTLVAKGLEPSLEAVRAEKSFAEASAKVNTIRAAIQEINDRRTIAIQEHNAEILQELAEANLELSKLEKAVSVAADKSDRSIIKSPSDGIVNRVLISTIGGVLRAGEAAVEIVPSGSELKFEAKISPMDIGYLQKGQTATVKLSTYDFSIYGSLGGTVEIVGSDSVEEENGESYYIAQIEPISDITTTGKILEIIPGMTAQIDIITGKRTVLSYISSPITKTMTTAFKEK